MIPATRFAILAIAGATALPVAACSSSNTSSPTTTPSTVVASQTPGSSAAPANGGTRVAGLIASVAGDSIQVTEQTGTATVGFTTSTKVSELTSAGLPDVTVGSCVAVRPTGDSPQNGAAVTAEGVRITEFVDGKCQEPKQPPAGDALPQPPSGGPPAGPPPGGGPPVQGTVASVSGNTIVVNGADNGGQTTVTVSDKTIYSKEATTNSQAIAAGKCITADGTQGDGGALQATEIMIRPATNGKCPAAGPPPPGPGG